MRQIKLDLYDPLNEKSIERTIDVSNVLIPDENAKLGFEKSVLGTEQETYTKITEWIVERGNYQHDTILVCQNFEIINQ